MDQARKADCGTMFGRAWMIALAVSTTCLLTRVVCQELKYESQDRFSRFSPSLRLSNSRWETLRLLLSTWGFGGFEITDRIVGSEAQRKAQHSMEEERNVRYKVVEIDGDDELTAQRLMRCISSEMGFIGRRYSATVHVRRAVGPPGCRWTGSAVAA
jgi:hypothetical protein